MLLTHDGGRRGERGVVAVIAAGVILMCATLLFGMIEMMWLSREARRARDLAESLALGDASMMLSSPFYRQESDGTLSYAYSDYNIPPKASGPYFGTKQMQQAISLTAPDMSVVSVQSRSKRSEFDIFDQAVVLKGNQYTVKPTLDFLSGSPFSFIDSRNYRASMLSEVFQYQTSNILPQPVTIIMMVDRTSSVSLPAIPGQTESMFHVIMDAISKKMSNEVKMYQNRTLPLTVNWGLTYLTSETVFPFLMQGPETVFPLYADNMYNLRALKNNTEAIQQKINYLTSGAIKYWGEHTAIADNVNKLSNVLGLTQFAYSPAPIGQETPTLIYLFTDGGANEIDGETLAQETYYTQGLNVARSQTPGQIANTIGSKIINGIIPFLLQPKPQNQALHSSTSTASLSADQTLINKIHYKYDTANKTTLTPGSSPSDSGSAPVISLSSNVQAQFDAANLVLNECYVSMNGQDPNFVQPYSSAPIPHGTAGWDGGLKNIFSPPSAGGIQRPNAQDANDGMMYVYWVDASLTGDDPRVLVEYPVRLVGDPSELKNPASSSTPLPFVNVAFDSTGHYLPFDPKTFKSYPPQAYYNATLHRFTISTSMCTNYLSWYYRRANSLTSDDRPPALRIRWSVPHAVDCLAIPSPSPCLASH